MTELTDVHIDEDSGEEGEGPDHPVQGGHAPVLHHIHHLYNTTLS